MIKRINIFAILIFIVSSHLIGQIYFDYSGVELILDHFSNNQDNTEKIVNNQGYQHIILHSKK